MSGNKSKIKVVYCENDLMPENIEQKSIYITKSGLAIVSNDVQLYTVIPGGGTPPPPPPPPPPTS